MRVLVSSLSAAGHLAALKPLVRAASAAGAEVRIVVESGALAAFDGIEATVVLFPPMEDELVARSERTWRMAGAMQARGDVYAANEIVVREAFGVIQALRGLSTLRAQIDEFRPDLVLADPFEPAATLAATDAGVALALASWSMSSVLSQWMPVLLEGAAAATGTDAASALDRARRAVRFSPLPAGLDDADDADWAAPMRWHPSPDMPRRRATASDRSQVYATLGSVVGQIPPLANRFLAAVGAAVAMSGATGVVTVGRETALERLDVPGGLRVEPFLDHTEVMPGCDVVISHGGINTVLDAAACGVPQLLLPMQSIDQHANAAMLEGRGVAIGLPPDRQTPESVQDALARLLTDEAIHQRVGMLAEEMARQPSTAMAWESATG